jgi:hypothetical protein
MAVTKIPDEDHIVRHCKHSQYFIHNGKIRPHPEAFHLRQASATLGAEKELSGVHYEWFEGTQDEKMSASCHFIRVSMKRKDALLRLNSGLIKKQGAERSIKLRVTHEPDDECPPYAAIHGLPAPPDDTLCGLLASLSVIDAIDLTAINP